VHGSTKKIENPPITKANQRAMIDHYFRPTALDLLPSNVQRLVICSEYGWRDYHYLLHSCYSQPDASYWFQAAFELWRNTAMLVILTSVTLVITVGFALAVQCILFLITAAATRICEQFKHQNQQNQRRKHN
jgi:hypothetical protein